MIAMCEVAGYVVTAFGDTDDDIIDMAVRAATISYQIKAERRDVKIISYFNQETKSWT